MRGGGGGLNRGLHKQLTMTGEEDYSRANERDYTVGMLKNLPEL